MRLIFNCLAYLSLLNLAPAQNADSSATDSTNNSLPVYQGEPVIINASRSPQSLLAAPYATESIQIQDNSGINKNVSLEETLQGVPGLFVNNRYNFALGDRINIRGIGARSSFGVRGIKILLDDIPLTMPDGQSQLNNLDLASAGKIEIIKGASSAMYGNAAGGLLNIESEEIPAEETVFTPRFLFGTDNLLLMQGKLTSGYSDSDFMINFSKFKTSGFRQNSAAEYWSVNAVNRYKVSDQLKLNGVINFYDAPYALNPSSLSRQDADNNRNTSRFFVRQQGSAEKTQQLQAGVTLNYKSSQSSLLKVTLYGLGRQIKNPIPSRIIDLDRLAGGLRSAYSDNSRWNNTDINWTAGLDMEFQADIRKEYANAGLAPELVGQIKPSRVIDNIKYGEKLQHQDERVISVGPFINMHFNLSKNWILTAAGRYDHYTVRINDRFLADSSDDSGHITMEQLSPMTGLTYLFHNNHSLFINYSTAFQTPTTSELGNTPDDRGLNPDLKPEKMKSYELGIKGIIADHSIYYQAVFFHFRIEDMLIPYQSNTSEEIYFRNAGNAQNLGLEFSMDWNISSTFGFLFSCTFMDFIFQDYSITDTDSDEFFSLKNKKIPGVAPGRISAEVTYVHPSQLFTSLRFNWTDAYFTNDFNGPFPGQNSPQRNFINRAAATVDTRIGKNWSFNPFDLQLFIGIDNIFNTKYNSSVVPNALNDNFFEPAAGRTWYSGIRLSL